MCEKSLFSGEPPVYSFPAAAKSAAGRENPSYSMATQHAPRVFFCVFASVHPFYGQRFLYRCTVCIMVARAGPTSVGPVFIEAGFSPPFGLPPDCENSGGGVNRYSMEIAIMATVLNTAHPEFIFIFAAVRRSRADARPCMLRTVAADERTARLSLVRDYMLSFAGRVPVKAVAA